MAPSSAGGTALGGVFLATENVARLTDWYRALGIPIGPEGHCFLAPEGGAGTPPNAVVFSIMPASTDLPRPTAEGVREEPYGIRRVTLNLRVRGLDGVVADLRERGDVVAGPRDYGYGRFAWVHDPDGNIVEMWEPTPS